MRPAYHRRHLTTSITDRTINMRIFFLIASIVVFTQVFADADNAATVTVPLVRPYNGTTEPKQEFTNRSGQPTDTSATPSTGHSTQPTSASTTPFSTTLTTLTTQHPTTAWLSTSSATPQKDNFTGTWDSTQSSIDNTGQTTLSQTAGTETTTTSTDIPSPPVQETPTAPETSTTATDESTPSAAADESNTILIVCASVGVLLLLIIIAIIIFVVCRYRRKKKAEREPLINSEPTRIPTVITNPRIQKTPKTTQHGYRATGPNAPFHYEAKDFHFRGPAKFDRRPLGVEDLPEPCSTETALSYRKSEHVQFDPDLNEVYEIGPEVEVYLDRSTPDKPKKSKSNEPGGRRDPNKAIIER